MDPAICMHPTERLIRRGSGRDKCWTCRECLRRWERLPLSHFEPKGATPENADLITFGRYMGQNYQYVWNEDSNYCQWILQTLETGEDCSTAMKRFGQYIVMMERTLGFEEVQSAKMDVAL